MTNSEIICNEAIMNGLFSAAEIEELLSQGLEVPLHTYAGWKIRGKSVRAGERGFETRLWKKRKGKKKDEENDSEDVEEDGDFYLAKAYLFSGEQVENID